MPRLVLVARQPALSEADFRGDALWPVAHVRASNLAAALALFLTSKLSGGSERGLWVISARCKRFSSSRMGVEGMRL